MFYSQSLEVLNPAKALRDALEDDCVEPRKHKEEANMDNPCIGCDVGWESISSAGSMSCRDECERLKAWEAKKKVNKPRICEVLGVEVNQNFQFNDFPFDEPKTYFVGSDGEIKNTHGGEVTSSELCYIINKADYIIRKPHWTEQEVKDAKTVRRVFGRNGTVERHRKVMTEPYSNLVFDHLYINEELFPSIKPGQSYTLDEIIGGES